MSTSSLLMARRMPNRFWRTVMMGSAVTGGLYFTIRYKNNNNVSLPSEKQRMATFDKLSSYYDKAFQFDEWFLRMGKYREELIKQAQGRVLEVGAGTGNNLPYYVKNDNQIKEVHFVDKSQNMMKKLEHKPIAQETIFKEFLVNDSENLDYGNNSFDSVVDTFGLCSYEHPEIALNEMIRVCKPGQKLLLLEHGTSNWNLIKQLQQRHFRKHLNDWGCYINRDILSYLENRNDIEITKLDRKHFGTTYYIEAIKTDGKSLSSSLSNKRKLKYNEKRKLGMDINIMVHVS